MLHRTPKCFILNIYAFKMCFIMNIYYEYIFIILIIYKFYVVGKLNYTLLQ